VATTTASKRPQQQHQHQLQSNPNTQRSASLNACPQENCLNGGTCLGYSGNYTCTCASGYTGLAYISVVRGYPKRVHADYEEIHLNEFYLHAVNGP